MGKRRHDPVSDEEQEAMETGDESEMEKPLKAKKQKAIRTAKKPVFRNEDVADDEEEEEEPPVKKRKAESTSTKKKVSSTEAGAVLTDASGDKYVDLGKKKRATVRVFKNSPLLDIREFYDAGGDEKPGKKGISLTPEQWNVLKSNMDAIDSFFTKVQKK